MEESSPAYPPPTAVKTSTALIFVTIGLIIYAGLYWASERLVYRTGDTNSFFKLEMADSLDVDWVILGASHAMPLDYADFNDFMERETARDIINLAAPGAGPLYNRFVLEHFFARGGKGDILYVVDSFAFYSPLWNEERFADAKLIRRTPLDLGLAKRLVSYSFREGVAVTALLDYLSGFSKINSRERFERDIWEGEAQFGRVFRPSSVADKKRVAYLFSDGTRKAMLDRYRGILSSLIGLASERGSHVILGKMPVPERFFGLMPDEAAFDATISDLASTHGVAFHDFSGSLDDPKHYSDTDHLNRDGLTVFFKESLRPLLRSMEDSR